MYLLFSALGLPIAKRIANYRDPKSFFLLVIVRKYDVLESIL